MANYVHGTNICVQKSSRPPFGEQRFNGMRGHPQFLDYWRPITLHGQSFEFLDVKVQLNRSHAAEYCKNKNSRYSSITISSCLCHTFNLELVFQYRAHYKMIKQLSSDEACHGWELDHLTTHLWMRIETKFIIQILNHITKISLYKA